MEKQILMIFFTQTLACNLVFKHSPCCECCFFLLGDSLAFELNVLKRRHAQKKE